MEFCFGVKRRRLVPLRRAGGLCEQRPRSQRQLAPAATCAPSCPARDPGVSSEDAASMALCILQDPGCVKSRSSFCQNPGKPCNLISLQPQKEAFQADFPQRASTCVQAASPVGLMLRDPLDCGPPGSSIRDFPVRILEPGAACPSAPCQRQRPGGDREECNLWAGAPPSEPYGV